MKAYWGSTGIAPRILDPGTRWRRVVNFTPRLLYSQGNSPWYPLDRMLGGPHSRSGRGGEEKNSQHLSVLEPPIIQYVAQRYTTELSRLTVQHNQYIKWPLNQSIKFLKSSSRPALGPTQPPTEWVPGALSLGIKRPGREDDHSSPSSAEVKEWVELYLHSHFAFMAWCLVKAQGQLYFTFTITQIMCKLN
jgi:hypothetical protein